MHSLPLLHRLNGSKVILLGEGEAGAAKRRLLERAGAEIVGEDDPSARLAFIALDEPEEAAARLKARGLLLTVPSILERGPVLIAVGTGGASAGLAKALRLRLEALLPASLGALAEGLKAARGAMRQRFPQGADRRRALDIALAEGGVLDPLRAESAERLPGWLAGATAGGEGLVEFTVHSDDPDDLTLRQARWLGAADLVAFEAGVSVEILSRARADASRVELARGEATEPGEGLAVVIRRG